MDIDYGKYANRGLVGLANLGNTCYMNSALQCLSACLDFTDYFISKRYREDIDESTTKRKTWILLESFVKTHHEIWKETDDKRPLVPTSFKNAFGALARYFRGNAQQDSHECILFILELLHDALQYEIEGSIRVKTDKELNTRQLMEKKAMQDWVLYFKDQYSIIVDLFYGQFHSIHICGTCNHQSFVYDPFTYIMLPIPEVAPRPGRDITIYDCFAEFIKQDLLEDENKYLCESETCKGTRQNGVKIMKIWKQPKILIITLKRFLKNGQKNDAFIDCPKTLDIVPYMSEFKIPSENWNRIRNSKENKFSYTLFAVSCHSGGTGGGHYTANTLNANGNWYNFDDTRVTQISPESVVTKQAYVLFYKRKL